jgi:hypothetical protein
VPGSRVVGQDLLPPLVGVRIQEALLFVQHVHGRGEVGRVVPLRLEDPPHLRLDAVHFGKPELVYLVGGHVRRGVVAELVVIESLPVGQFPDAVVGGGDLLLVLEELDQAPVRGVDGVTDLSLQRPE